MAHSKGVYLLKAHPEAKPWGGGHLDRLAGASGNQSIGEYVLFSDIPKFAVKVLVDGKEIELALFWRELRLKTREMPFMLKILSTAEPISLQNHPSDADVKTLGLSGEGKFECWTILDSDISARAYLGLKNGESKNILNNLEAEMNPLAHFNEIAVSRGDVISLNPGLVHSTTGRLLFYEIQQTSDHTFRIHDFGRGRELHLKEAMHCMGNQTPQIGKFSEKLQTEKFSVDFHRVESELSLKRRGGEFSVMTWFGQKAEFRSGDHRISLSWGDSVLVLTNEPWFIKNLKASSTERTKNLPMLDMLFEAYVE